MSWDEQSWGGESLEASIAATPQWLWGPRGALLLLPPPPPHPGEHRAEVFPKLPPCCVSLCPQPGAPWDPLSPPPLCLPVVTSGPVRAPCSQLTQCCFSAVMEEQLSHGGGGGPAVSLSAPHGPTLGLFVPIWVRSGVGGNRSV